MSTATCLSELGAGTIQPQMIRETVDAELKRRNWPLLRLAQETGISYSRLHGWMNPAPKQNRAGGISSDNLELVMKVLGLRISRGAAKPSRPRRKPQR